MIIPGAILILGPLVAEELSAAWKMGLMLLWPEQVCTSQSLTV